jgi:hypothetical protein
VRGRSGGADLRLRDRRFAARAEALGVKAVISPNLTRDLAPLISRLPPTAKA